ncbi:MAG: NUDIX domain-containing protein [Candidatus Roizmanbacteria bacterium]|nr:MAG: NUDIX domain-containing protein [Candidatus Roizmanbacteria bacterium]
MISMPHIHERIDFTVEVFIIFKNKVLLRKHDKYKKWLSVGGHIELHEDPVEAAIREVKEEVGLDIKLDDSLKRFREKDETIELIPPYFLNRNRINKTHEHITFIYFARSKTDIINQSENEKSEECRWFTRKEIEENKDIIPNIKFYAFKALDIISS